MRVLIAEDDDFVGDALVAALTPTGHVVTRVVAGADVLLRHQSSDLLLLDLGLVDGDGLDVLRKLRTVSDLPVVVITARSDERSVVRALHLGADDFVVKPIRLPELLARIEAVTRRTRREATTASVVHARGVLIDLPARVATRDGIPIQLTATEFATLAALASRVGTAVSRQQIMDEVWGDAFAAASRSLDVHLTQLRAKLGDPQAITTIRGFGYRLDP